MFNFNAGNPAPAGPLLPGTINARNVSIGFGNCSSVYPTKVYGIANSSVSISTTIDFKSTPFNYITFNNTSNITITFNTMPVGTMFIADLIGSGNVSFRVLKNEISGVYQYINSSAPIVGGTVNSVVVFNDFVVSVSFTNPTAV